MVGYICSKIVIRMALSVVHTSAKATDVTKLLLLNTCRVMQVLPRRVRWRPHLTITRTINIT